jgi:transcriptional regulator with XRE-family HTH domain
MHTRITKIVEIVGISKTDFAQKLNLSQGMISRLCSGSAKPSDRTISDICRVFNVNRRYLEHGEEPIFMPELDPDTDFINILLEKSDSPFVDIISKTAKIYMMLDPEGRKLWDDFAASLKEKLNQGTKE